MRNPVEAQQRASLLCNLEKKKCFAIKVQNVFFLLYTSFMMVTPLFLPRCKHQGICTFA